LGFGETKKKWIWYGLWWRGEGVGGLIAKKGMRGEGVE